MVLPGCAVCGGITQPTSAPGGDATWRPCWVASSWWQPAGPSRVMLAGDRRDCSGSPPDAPPRTSRDDATHARPSAKRGPGSGVDASADRVVGAHGAADPTEGRGADGSDAGWTARGHPGPV